MLQVKTLTKLSKKQLIKESTIIHIEIIRGAIKKADEVSRYVKEN